MSDPCKACGAPKCVAFEACQCCGKCRNCGQEHGPLVSPFVYPGIPAQPIYPSPIGPAVPPYATPWWEIARDQFQSATTGGIPTVETIAFNGVIQ